MKKFLLLLLLLLPSIACAQADQPADEVHRLIEQGALVVDVRSAEEFKSGHLENAVNIPHTEVEKRLSEFGQDKTRSIVVYCRSGRRSGMAQEVLRQNGFTGVVNGGGYGQLKR